MNRVLCGKLLQNGRWCGLRNGHNDNRHESTESLEIKRVWMRENRDRYKEKEHIYRVAYYAANSDKERARNAAWRIAHRDQARETDRLYRMLTVKGSTRHLRQRHPELAAVIEQEMREELAKQGIEA